MYLVHVSLAVLCIFMFPFYFTIMKNFSTFKHTKV